MYLKVTFIVALTHLCLSFGYQIERHEENFEVDAGNTIILHCKSNDDNHNFMFWHLTTTGEVIGPRNEFNNNKFKYEVLSGNLTIRAVTANDAGTYSCISDGVDKRDISVHSVKLLIKTGWNGVINEKITNQVQNNNSGNLWKVSAILGSIFVFLVIILVGLHIYHKETERPKYFDIVEQNDDDEDSTEELFTREPSTSGLNKIISDRDETSDNFEKVYSAININST